MKELLSSRPIEPADFREMKSEYSSKLEKLAAKLNAQNNDQVDFNALLNKGLNNLKKPDYLYEIANSRTSVLFQVRCIRKNWYLKDLRFELPGLMMLFG